MTAASTIYMQRCLELAAKGAGAVAPNPMVGAVLVYQGRIIGEGYHRQYGQAHAEVNCIQDAIAGGHADKISESELYVSLEPCAHFGKTPPCADLIIRHRVPRVIVGIRDPFPQVNGRGIEKLIAAGVDVQTGVLEKECLELNKRFFTFHSLHRPFVILKWAQTADGFIAGTGRERLLISNAISNRLVHRWRSEEAAILVGTRTATLDDPQLNTRLWSGNSPVRLVVDRGLKLPASLHLFDGKARTIVFNTIKNETRGNLEYYQVTRDTSLVQQVLHALRDLHLQSLLVEGGAATLQSFIDEGAWDEARIITNTSLVSGGGLPAPVLPRSVKVGAFNTGDDRVDIFKPVNTA